MCYHNIEILKPMGSSPDSDSEGGRFDPCRAHHYENH